MIVHPSLNKEMPICQYMDLDYLIRMLATGQYFIRQKRGFPDKREQALPVNQMFPVHLANAKVPEEVLNTEAEERQKGMIEYEEHSSALASCWTASNPDSYLMWKSYTSKMGACITSSIEDFDTSLSQNAIEIACGPIEYGSHNAYDDFTTRMFKKEPGYAAENEIRFYIGVTDSETPNSNGGVYLNVDCKRLIHKVILSPLIDRIAARHLCEWLNSTYGISVVSSSLKTIR